MGGSVWSDNAYSTLKSSYTSKSVDDIFIHNKSRTISDDMSPKGVKVREARDSDNHPQSLAILIGLDETGSMGQIPEIIAREKLGVLMDVLLNHGIPDPQVLFAGIGDHYADHYPLQVGQFESGTDELNKWLTSVYLEGNGGGQNMESYLLAWLFAARHTSIDCFEKRKEKGFLFTIGDEACHKKVEANKLKELMGYAQSDDITDKEILNEASRIYNVFHIHINEASYRDDPQVIGYWKDLLDERLIILDDYNAIAETIASIVGVIHGIELDKITASFDHAIADTVTKALVNIKSGVIAKQDEGMMNL